MNHERHVPSRVVRRAVQIVLSAQPKTPEADAQALQAQNPVENRMTKTRLRHGTKALLDELDAPAFSPDLTRDTLLPKLQELRRLLDGLFKRIRSNM